MLHPKLIKEKIKGKNVWMIRRDGVLAICPDSENPCSSECPFFELEGGVGNELHRREGDNFVACDRYWVTLKCQTEQRTFSFSGYVKET